jgi:hypothetical protein
MPKYWLSRDYGVYGQREFVGPFDNFADAQEKLWEILAEGNSATIKLFKELELEVKEDA